MKKSILIKPLIITGAIATPLLLIIGFAEAARHVTTAWHTVITACVNSWNTIVNSFSHPDIIFISIVSGVLGLGLIKGIIFLIVQFYKTKQTQARLQAKVISSHPLTKQFSSLCIIDEQKLLAVTLGILKPEIYISTGLIQQLSREELESVIAHEKHHVRHRHTLCNMLIHLIKSFLFFIPVFPQLARSAILKHELEADREAITITSRKDLASAILKTIEGNHIYQAFPVTAAPFSVIADRTRAVLGEHISPITNISKKLLALSVVIVSSITFFLLQPQSSHVHAQVTSQVTNGNRIVAADYCHRPNQSFFTWISSEHHIINMTPKID